MRRGNRRGITRLKIIDALLLAVVAVVVAVAARPYIESANEQATVNGLLDNLASLRFAIESYEREHDGRIPVVHDGGLPQLVRATDREGALGPSGNKYPFGPYLRGGMPVNTITGRSIVTLTETFPPSAVSGNGGWLYHQPTGQIVPDLEEYLNR